ncbi:hypothetical protein BKA93DRAFT_787393 [Sparassis latifolia]
MYTPSIHARPRSGWRRRSISACAGLTATLRIPYGDVSATPLSVLKHALRVINIGRQNASRSNLRQMPVLARVSEYESIRGGERDANKCGVSSSRVYLQRFSWLEESKFLANLAF